MDMKLITKSLSLSKKTAEPEKDMDLINQYSVRELKADEVYCYSLILCDNEVDRDYERFTRKTLEELAPMFLGKTGISDHRHLAANMHSRVYRTMVEDTNKKTQLGDTLSVLRADAYMLKSAETQPMIDAIEAGILKEVSVGCGIAKRSCSICGSAFKFNWETWSYMCEENSHRLGKQYDGKLCAGELTGAVDAYEFSFVAIPAQRNAGVIKSFEGVEDVAEYIATHADQFSDKDLHKLAEIVHKACLSADERELRTKIAEEARQKLQEREIEK